MSCEKTSQKTGTLLDFVPKEASVILKIEDWESVQNNIKNNSLLLKLDTAIPYLSFTEPVPLFNHLKPTSQSLLCLNKVNDSLTAYTFISKQSAPLFQKDSIKNKTIETLKIEDQTFQRVTLDKKIAFTAIVDSVFIASSSQQIIMDILKGKTVRDNDFKKVFELPISNDFTVLLHGNTIALTDSTHVNLPSWSALDFSIAPESLTATGIALATDSIPQLLTVFKDQIPQQNEMASVIPMDALDALSFTFDDAEKLQNKLQKFRGEKEIKKTTGVFDSASEMGSITLKNGTAIFLKSIDPSTTIDALARFVSTESSFREIEIKSFSEPDLFQRTFAPLVNSNQANYVFQLENFFLFTETELSAQDLIAAYQNNSTLKNTSYFENTSDDLSSSSSLLLYKMQGNFSKTLSGFFNSYSKKSFKNTSMSEYPLVALQFSFDRNFAHVTLSCKKGSAKTKNSVSSVSEKFSINLENTVLGIPQLISNSGDVVVQDINNKLYYISESGKILWTKNLKSPILGKIAIVKISNKGDNYVAFATKNAVYVLDKNGKNANAFPLNFKDEITQPLAVFDYDNNHNYRFVVVQDKSVLMYDKQGKIVKGFNFSKTKSSIIQPPSHIRMGKKDYILIAEENGTLNILSRVGKSRVPVSKKFNFSEIPVTSEDNTFVVITKENIKERISQDGKVSSLKLNVGSSYWFATNKNTKATLDDNLLRIDGKLAELPLGIYSKPDIYEFHQKTYISITETQENKVYVFNKNGNLIKGFPVYGTSEASMGQIKSKNGISLSVKGDPKGIIVYTID